MPSGPLPRSTDSVLITGGTSYLGRCLSERLLARGTPVHIVTRPSSDLSRLDGLDGPMTRHSHDGTTAGLMSIVADARPGAVFHMATQYLRTHTADQIEGLVRDNILFGTQLLEAVQGAGCTRLINLNTFFQYYDSADYRPVNLYAATKQAFEDILYYYRDAHDWQTASLVLYDVYGPDDWRRKLMWAIREAQVNGTPLKLLDADTALYPTYIDDVVDALIHTLDQGIAGGPYAVRGDDVATLSDIVAAFERAGERPLDAHYGAYPTPPRTPGTLWQGTVLPGWSARVSLDDGVRRFLAGAR